MSISTRSKTFIVDLGLIIVVAGVIFAPAGPALSQEAPEAMLEDPLQRVGAWPFGPSYAVELDPARDLVFLGAGGVVLILDGSDPTAPTLITDTLRTVGLVEDMAFDAVNQRLFIACGEGGLEIWDVAAPGSPARLSVTEVLYFGYDTPVGRVQLWQHFVVVECQWGYVHSLDVSDPANPVQVSFNGLMGNPARDIHISEDGQVHSSGAQRYQRLDIDAGGTLRNSGSKDFDYGPYEVFGTPEVAYVGHGGNVVILDLLLPFFPPWTHFNAGGVGGLEVHNGIAYIINGIGLRLYDVTVHNSPFHLGTMNSEMFFYDFVVRDGLVYIAAGLDGLRVIDVGDTANPVEIGSFDQVFSVTWKSVLVGDHAFLAADRDGVLVIDIADPQNPELVARFATTDAVRDIAVVGDRLFVAASDAGLRIVDISNPVAPLEIGNLEDWSAWRLEPEGDIVWVVEGIANQPDVLHAVNVSDPALPVAVGTMALPDIVWDLIAVFDHLYIAAHDDGIRIVDTSVPGSPVEVGSYALPSVTEFDVRDRLLYVASHESFGGGLFILDLSDPVAPAQIGSYQAPGFAVFHVDVQGNYAAVSDGSDLHLMFVGDPANPVDRDEYRMPGGLVGITVSDRLVFVSDGPAGLQIVENTLFDNSGGGLMWQVQASGTGEDLHGVCFADPSTGWAVGDAGAIVATTDGGASWQPQTSGVAASLLDIACVDEEHAWVVGAGGIVLATFDGGASWATQTGCSGGTLGSVDFVDADRGWAVGASGAVCNTDDGGATWIPQPSGTSSFLYGVSFVDALHGWIASGDFGTVLRTTDGGASWQSVDTGSTAVLFNVDFADASNGWAVGMFGAVVTTTDGGVSWATQPTPHPPEWLYGVHFIDASTGWTVGFDGKVITTSNGGATWDDQSSGVHVQLEDVHFVDAARGWVVGYDGTIVRATDSSTGLFADGFESGGTSAWNSTVP